ncbi:MAG TPA: 2OG-Fe(II) oxygenase [Chitinophagales bacterium]|nr:2OG-Fe(II) oxygenase [Chitinophagales bacterium]
MQLNVVTKDIYTVENFWSAQECEEYIKKTETIGFEPATINTDFGVRRVESVRNNNRVMYKDVELANAIWQRAKDFVPAQTGNSVAIGLNELFRFYKYEPGQQFKKHRDNSFIRNSNEASYYTFMIYLNDGYTGGTTTFNNVEIEPKQGTALIFRHALEHAGTEVETGVKYVLRTDVMYRLPE